MKKGLALVLLFFSIVVGWWIYQSSLINQPKQTSSPNVVSFQPKESQTTKPKSKNIPKESKPNKSNPEITITSHSSVETKEDKELTYLDVYRMTRQFETCQNVIYQLMEEENFDPVTSFENRITQLKALHPEWPTASQKSAITRHSSQCEQLLNTAQTMDLPKLTQAEGRTYAPMYQLKQKLEQYLMSLKPKTTQEQAIAEVLNLALVWREHYQQVLTTSKGDGTSNKTAIEALQEQITLLKQEQQEISRQYQESPETVDTSRFTEILLEIEQLKKQVIELKLVDPVARKEAMEKFEVVNDMLFAQLKTTDPDVFFEAQRTLELNRHNTRNFGYEPYKNQDNRDLKVPFVEYVSPGEVIKDIIGMQDNEMFGLVINYATQLYHCELGADCGPEGNWTPQYCHLGYDNLVEAACDNDLTTFYRDYFLNQNQWHDVQMVLDIIRGLYAN